MGCFELMPLICLNNRETQLMPQLVATQISRYSNRMQHSVRGVTLAVAELEPAYTLKHEEAWLLQTPASRWQA